jgi:membrane protein implicated in regulation of membrane protease activity
VAGLAWTVGLGSALAGVMVSGSRQRISLALLGFAAALVLLGAVVMVLGRRRREARSRRALEAAQAALARLEYIPPVTSGTRRIRWRGSRSRMKPVADQATDLVGHDGDPGRRSGRAADAVATKQGVPKIV